jgi:aminomethyltransferase
MTNGFNMARVQRGARLRRSPFYAATQRYNPQGFTVYNHMLFPIHFADLEVEYEKLVNDVTVWDVSVERQVEITGKDAFEFTNLLTPRDLTQCQVGQGKYVLITDEKGGIINDPVLLRLGENHFWLALADSDVLLWAKGVALSSGLSVDISEPDVSPLQIQGPKSKGVVDALFGSPALDLDYYYFLETTLDGIPVILTRTGWSGEVGYEIYLRDGSKGVRLWEMVMEAGKPFNIAPTGPSDIRRVEAGILNYGADMTLEETPYEVGLGWLVDLDQPADFIGKPALRSINEQGVTRKLVGVEIEGPAIEFNMTKWPVYQHGQQVGKITSALYSPRFEKNIGYAMVPVSQAGIGTGLTVAVEGTDHRNATVVRKPFHDPTKELPKS